MDLVGQAGRFASDALTRRPLSRYNLQGLSAAIDANGPSAAQTTAAVMIP